MSGDGVGHQRHGARNRLVSPAPTAPATTPPADLPGLDPAWSRLVEAGRNTFHVLDNQVTDADVTLVCVHGNPTWAYTWRDVIATAPPGVRVIAIDQLDMGYSERTGTTRRLAQRVEDLGAVIDALDVTTPIITVGHDWGGAISLGWAVDNVDRLAGVVLANTAVHQPEGARAPLLIRMVRPFIDWICVRFPLFVWGTTALARPRLSREVRDAYLAPYRTPERRDAVGEFVADIPLDPDHPSFDDLAGVAAGMKRLSSVPT
ncbi:MAG: alpha/beta fold hydrolase, partial [Acidimicrobiia bacterium]|nr:alpha/beta fold hydrolase [Acidimicrobiia bacterium]